MVIVRCQCGLCRGIDLESPLCDIWFLPLQRYTLDLQAISLAFLATILPPVEEMTRHRPPAYVGIRRTYILVTVMTVLWAFCDMGSFAFLLTRPWVAGNATAVNVSTVMLLSIHNMRKEPWLQRHVVSV